LCRLIDREHMHMLRLHNPWIGISAMQHLHRFRTQETENGNKREAKVPPPNPERLGAESAPEPVNLRFLCCLAGEALSFRAADARIGLTAPAVGPGWCAGSGGAFTSPAMQDEHVSGWPDFG
jgi:hypothetical protein